MWKAAVVGACIACMGVAVLLVGRSGPVELGSLGSLEAMAHGGDAASKSRHQKAEIHKALHHLSSTALVQRAASECANDSKCVPSVNELVKRAASACAKDPACVCDWGRYPKQCFLSEVQRHEQLVRAAKRLEESIHQDAVATHARHKEVSSLEHDDKKLKDTISHGREALAARNFEGAKTALAKAEFLHQITVLSVPHHPLFHFEDVCHGNLPSFRVQPLDPLRIASLRTLDPLRFLSLPISQRLSSIHSSYQLCCVGRAGLSQTRHLAKRGVDSAGGGAGARVVTLAVNVSACQLNV